MKGGIPCLGPIEYDMHEAAKLGISIGDSTESSGSQIVEDANKCPSCSCENYSRVDPQKRCSRCGQQWPPVRLEGQPLTRYDVLNGDEDVTRMNRLSCLGVAPRQIGCSKLGPFCALDLMRSNCSCRALRVYFCPSPVRSRAIDFPNCRLIRFHFVRLEAGLCSSLAPKVSTRATLRQGPRGSRSPRRFCCLWHCRSLRRRQRAMPRIRARNKISPFAPRLRELILANRNARVLIHLGIVACAKSLPHAGAPPQGSLERGERTAPSGAGARWDHCFSAEVRRGRYARALDPARESKCRKTNPRIDCSLSYRRALRLQWALR